MQTFKLMPINGRKSLNNQHVNRYTVDGVETSDLISYTTRVAAYNHSTNEVSIYVNPSNTSQTTRNHINAFLVFYGFDAMNNKQMIEFVNRSKSV